MRNPRFSVIIGCEHSPKSLRNTLSALRGGDVEVIVADSAGIPERREIAADSIDLNVETSYLCIPGAHRSVAWNAAARKASGHILAFLDDDCIPLPGWLSAIESSFSRGKVGAVGGPDRVPENSPIFEQCLEYVLTSFIGTLGMRSGKHITAYYPRPWNMAVSKLAFVQSGGFDENSPEAPEIPMLRKMEGLGYKILYQPEALVLHHRETGPWRFVQRDFRLARERGHKESQPGLDMVYGAACIALAAAGVASTRRSTFRMPLAVAAAYTTIISVSGIQAAVKQKSPALAVLVPPLILAHHTAHVSGYAWGKMMNVASRLLITK